MHLETLAKRLADKTNTPVLEKIILGEVPMSELPPECMLWTGAKLGTTSRNEPRVSRSSRDGLQFSWIGDQRPYGVIRWQGKRTSVARLIYLLIEKPDFEFRLFNQCRTPLCVNPYHFEVRKQELEVPEPPSDILLMGDDENIPEEELEEIVEAMLADYDPTSWEDVVRAEILEGIPLDLVREMLIKLNKGHLT